ncbi:unnamed protein product, partial [Mesorhabditis spiculigera]
MSARQEKKQESSTSPTSRGRSRSLSGSANMPLTLSPMSPRICRNHMPPDEDLGDPRTRKRIVVSTDSGTGRHISEGVAESMLLLEDNSTPSFPKKHKTPRFSFTKKKITCEDIDRWSIITFPFLFTLFNIIYWSYYLTRAQ